MMQIQSHSASVHNDGNVFFIPSLFNDTLRLLFEAHNYFDYEGYDDQNELPEELQMVFANEMSRVTMRLTSIMAWLMIRKANHEGNLDKSEDVNNYRLEARDICLVENKAHHTILAPFMVDLLNETYDLYLRVMRLDDLEGSPMQQQMRFH